MGALDQDYPAAFDDNGAYSDQRVFGEFAVQGQFSVASSQFGHRIAIIAFQQ
jgi:hypothetical protein